MNKSYLVAKRWHHKLKVIKIEKRYEHDIRVYHVSCVGYARIAISETPTLGKSCVQSFRSYDTCYQSGVLVFRGYLDVTHDSCAM